MSATKAALVRGLRNLHGTPAEGVPRWARRAAMLIPFTVLPSGLWRIMLIVVPHHLLTAQHGPLGPGYRDGSATKSTLGMPIQMYVIALSIVSEVLALLALGLVNTWGEVFPRRLPVLGGRQVRPLWVVVPAAFGAVFLTLLWTTAAVMVPTGRRLDGTVIGDGSWRAGLIQVAGDTGWHAWVFVAAYLPLVAWGPLLGAVTYAYAKRRSGDERRSGDQRRRVQA